MIKHPGLFFALLLFACISTTVNAQNTVSDLLKQGVELHNQGNFTGAVNKFNEVLKADPQNAYANYEMAFSLYELKQPKVAIPYLQKAVTSLNAKLTVAAYSLLASIYDEDNQHQEAIDTYQQAIKINPDYPQIYYNLGIAYSSARQYPEAEAAAIEAIKHNPKHGGSQRLYALATFHQNKRANALLGFCSFIALEPTGPLAAEAYGNIQHILQGGVLKDANGKTTITLSPKADSESITLNLGISMITQASQTQKLSGTDLFAYQLKRIFELAGQLSEKKTDKGFFDKYYADYFYKLAQSNNMPAFAHILTQSVNNEGNTKWLNASENKPKLAAMSEWLKTTPRDF